MDTLIILGMHRSGTSCLTGSLQQLGLNLGQVSNYNDYNTKGNKEDDAIGQLNESLLEYNGGSWRNPSDKLNWNAVHEKNRNEIIKHYETLPKPFGIKDPRMLFTLPFWLPVLNKVRLLGSLRHPHSVANSLFARKNIRIEKPDGLQLWHRYNKKLLFWHKKYGFDIVDFDLNADQYLSQITLIADDLELEGSNKDLDFFDNSLRKQYIANQNFEGIDQDIIDTYRLLKAQTLRPKSYSLS